MGTLGRHHRNYWQGYVAVSAASPLDHPYGAGWCRAWLAIRWRMSCHPPRASTRSPVQPDAWIYRVLESWLGAEVTWTKQSADIAPSRQAAGHGAQAPVSAA